MHKFVSFCKVQSFLLTSSSEPATTLSLVKLKSMSPYLQPFIKIFMMSLKKKNYQV